MRIVTVGDDDDSRVWEAKSGQQRSILSVLDDGVGHTSRVTNLAISSDGTRLASRDLTGKVWLWDVTEKKAIRSLNSEAALLALNQDGSKLAIVTDEHAIQIWDTLAGDLFTSYDGHPDRVESVRFSPDGRYLFTVSEDQTARTWQKWDAGNGKEPHKKELHKLEHSDSRSANVKDAVLSPNGERLVTTTYPVRTAYYFVEWQRSAA
jgi:WD40 repeat protein